MSDAFWMALFGFLGTLATLFWHNRRIEGKTDAQTVKLDKIETATNGVAEERVRLAHDTGKAEGIIEGSKKITEVIAPLAQKTDGK